MFALGVTAYELLAGRRAFAVPPCLEPSGYRPPALPAHVAEVVSRALSAEPFARPAADELARVLAGHMADSPPCPR